MPSSTRMGRTEEAGLDAWSSRPVGTLACTVGAVPSEPAHSGERGIAQGKLAAPRAHGLLVVQVGTAGAWIDIWVPGMNMDGSHRGSLLMVDGVVTPLTLVP